MIDIPIIVLTEIQECRTINILDLVDEMGSDVFWMADLDQNSVLDESEIANLRNSWRFANRMKRALDLNNDGVVDPVEWVQYVRRQYIKNGKRGWSVVNALLRVFRRQIREFWKPLSREKSLEINLEKVKKIKVPKKIKNEMKLREVIDLFNEGVIVKVENRHDFPSYGFPTNHVEIIGYIKNGEKVKRDIINVADNDPWDGLFLGVTNSNLFEFDKIYIVKTIVGVLFSSTGNHKLLLRAPAADFSNIKYARDIKQFIKAYESKWNISLSYVPIARLLNF